MHRPTVCGAAGAVILEGSTRVGPVDSTADVNRAPGESAPDNGHAQPEDQRSLDRRDSTGASDRLRQRMDQLPPGHPSSPYNADGSRQQALRLRDLDPIVEDDELAHDASERVDGHDADLRDDSRTPNVSPTSDRQPEDHQSPQAQVAADDPQLAERRAAEADHTTETELTTEAGSLPDLRPTADVETKSLSNAETTLRSDPATETARTADQTHPISDLKWAEHQTSVSERLGKAGDEGLETTNVHTTDPDHQQWTPERNRIQGNLVASLYEGASDVPCDQKSIVAGGLPGSGKSTTLGTRAGIDLTQYLMINPDNIKGEMAKEGLIPEVEGLSPMEASDLVHEEASAIAKQLARKAMSDGKNIIWDITMSSHQSTQRRIDDLHAAGYTVEGVFIDLPVEVSVRRADARHREDHNNYLAGKGLGGRYVPAEIIEAQVDLNWSSKNRRTFEEVKVLLNDWRCYDNSVDGRQALLTESSQPNDSHYEEQT
jgi:predicted kinase